MLITQTPLRVSIAGGGTDLPDYYRGRSGAVVSTAIDKYVYVIVNARYDEKIYIDYTRKEIVDHVDEIEHDLVREAARITGMTDGFEVAMMADIPSEGSGLGSSSSVTVGLLNAFHHFRGRQVSAAQLADEACSIEIDLLGRPIGRQDQYIAAFGGLKFIEFTGDGDRDHVDVTPIDRGPDELRKIGSNLLLFYTSVVRKSASILTEQRDRIVDTVALHDGIRSLADDARASMEKGNYDDIGRILRENWSLKRELASGITNEAIDTMVSTALDGGADGVKISGAGGGGFLLCYCRRENQDDLRRALSGYREMPFMLEPFGSRIVFQQRRYRW